MYVPMKYITVVLLLHQSMFESLTVMHPQLLAQLEALQEQKSMCLYVLLDNIPYSRKISRANIFELDLPQNISRIKF